MHLRILAPLLAALALLLPAAASAKAPHRYSPKHGAKCHKGYRRVKHHGHVYCVKSRKRHRTARALEKVKLHAHLDPTYTRNPLDPFEVTYAYSASATQEPAARSASVSTEEPAPLPKGVLSFYSDGILECSINVGGSATGDECPVDYQALGVHKVTTLYTAGEESATVTETENIGPLMTSVSLSLSYSDLPGGPEQTGPETWRLGTLVVTGSAMPSGSAVFQCDGDPGCIEPSWLPHSVSGAIEVPITVNAGLNGAIGPEPTCEEINGAFEEHGYPLLSERFEPDLSGEHLRVVTDLGLGYQASEAVASLDYSPTPPC